MHDLICSQTLIDSVEINRLITQLLLAIKAFHDKNLIHQDIKPGNILIFENEKRERSLKLNDFAFGYDPEKPTENKIPLASFPYASPEIIAAHYYYHEHAGFKYKYFHKQWDYYGKILFLKNKNILKAKIEQNQSLYAMPDKANDIWAAGVCLYELVNHSYPLENPEFKDTPLLASLLNPDRDSRLTVDQALLLHYMNINQYDEAKKLLYATPSLASYAESLQFETCLKKIEALKIDCK